MRARVNVVESNANGGMFRAANPPISSIIFVPGDTNTLRIRVEFAINGNRYRNEGGKAFLEIRRPYAQPNSQSGVDFQTVAGYEKSIRDLGSSQSVKIIDLTNTIGNPAPGPYRYTGISIEKTDERLPPNDPDDIIMSTEFLRDCVYLYAVDPAALSSKEQFVDRRGYFVNPPKRQTRNNKPTTFDTHYRSSEYAYERTDVFIESDYQKYEAEIDLLIEDFDTASIYEFSYLNPDNGFLELLEIDISDSISRIKEIIDIDSQDSTTSYELYYKGFNGYGSLTDYQNSQQLILADDITTVSNYYNNSNRPGFYRICKNIAGKSISTQYNRARTRIGASSIIAGNQARVTFYIDERRKVIIVKNLPHKVNFVSAIATHRNGVIELGSSQITSGASTVEIGISTIGLIDRKTYEVGLEFKNDYDKLINGLYEISWRYFKLPPRGVSISVENLGLGRVTRTNNPDELNDIRNRFKVTTSFLSSRNDSTAANVILQSAAIPETVITSDKKEYSDILTFRVKTLSFSSVSPEEIMPESSGSTSDGFVNWNDVNFTTSDRLYGKVYNFSLGMRDPNALQTNQSGYKWGKAGGFQRASLPSKKTSRSSSTLAPFEEVEAGAIFTIFEEGNIALTNPPSIVQLSVSIIPSYSFNQIEWSFQGAADTTFLDHVQVYGTYAGTEKLLGTSFRTNFYRDEELWNLPGDVTYRVVPVYNDYTFGDSRGITFRSMESTLPRIVMSDFANGEDARYFKPIASASFPPPNIDQEDLLSLDVTGQSTQTERSFTPVFEILSIEEASQAVQSGPDPGRTSESKKGATKKFRIGTPKPVSDIIKSGAPSLKDILSRETRIASDIAEPLGPGRRFRR